MPGVGSSADERLARTSFALLGGAELEEVRRLARLAALDAPTRLTHRYVSGARRGPYDARATLRRAARSGTEPDRILRRKRREVARQVVFLCDVSGSMRPFAPLWLALMQGATAGAKAEAFTFATRLTRVTRQLGGRDPGAGLRRAVGAAPDWSGGTRIVDALRAFTDRYGQRGLARDAVLVIISDGREPATEAAVRLQMHRLAKLTHRIIWVNPRWPGSGMPALVGGWAAALPFCDAVLSGHSLTAVNDVLTAIAE